MPIALPPGSSGWPLVGETFSFVGRGYAFIDERMARHGPVFRSHLFGSPAVFVSGADASALHADPDAVSRDGALPGSVLAMFGGPTVAQLDGEAHAARKSLINAGYDPAALLSYLPILQRNIDASLAAWAEQPEVPARAALKRFVLGVFAETLVGIEPGPRRDALADHYDTVITSGRSLPIRLPGTSYSQALAARDAAMTELAAQVAAHRAAPRDTALGRTLAAGAISDPDAVREMHHAILAGFTVFGHLAMLLAVLDASPELKALLDAEIATLPPGPPTARAIASLPTLARVTLELKRVTRVVPVSASKARRDLEVAGYRIPAGTRIFWSIQAHHMDPSSFAEPSRFDPDRFAPPREEHLRHPNAFAPQGMGPATGHRCPAIDYVTLLIGLFAIAVSRDYAVSFPAPRPAVPSGHVPVEVTDQEAVRFRRRASS